MLQRALNHVRPATLGSCLTPTRTQPRKWAQSPRVLWHYFLDLILLFGVFKFPTLFLLRLQNFTKSVLFKTFLFHSSADCSPLNSLDFKPFEESGVWSLWGGWCFKGRWRLYRDAPLFGILTLCFCQATVSELLFTGRSSQVCFALVFITKPQWWTEHHHV